MKRENIDKLDVYNLSMELADKIWYLVIEWAQFSRKTIGYQIVRASDSIAANISEGDGRYFYKENRQFCYIARGSLYETKTFLIKAKNRQWISLNDYATISDEIEILLKKLNTYTKYIESKINK